MESESYIVRPKGDINIKLFSDNIDVATIKYDRPLKIIDSDKYMMFLKNDLDFYIITPKLVFYNYINNKNDCLTKFLYNEFNKSELNVFVNNMTKIDNYNLAYLTKFKEKLLGPNFDDDMIVSNYIPFNTKYLDSDLLNFNIDIINEDLDTFRQIRGTYKSLVNTVLPDILTEINVQYTNNRVDDLRFMRRLQMEESKQCDEDIKKEISFYNPTLL